MLDQLVAAAKNYGASDLHLSVGKLPAIRVKGKIRYLHKNGALLEQYSNNNESIFEKDKLQQIVLGLLTKKQIEIVDNVGQVDLSWQSSVNIRCRINVYKERGNYALAVRLISNNIPTCEQLGLNKVVQELVKRKHGLLLVTGSTGSGKSTTLASLVAKLNNEENLHIITLEDPIEYILPGGLVHQREINTDTVSFAAGLRSALREDPDVILVGELRDAESLLAALQAAETGHLVLSTLHTCDAVSTINRILDMLPEQREQVRALLASVLLGVVSQRLILRRDKEERVAAREILINNNAIANLIREGKTHQIYSYMETSGGLGMLTMQQAIRKLEREGIL